MLGLSVVWFSVFTYYIWQQYQQQHNLEVVFLNVGQGDSILIKTPAGQNILVDGGPDSTVLAKLGHYLPFYNHQIDLMVLTHPHADHVSGLVEVLKRYKVKQILGTGVGHTSPEYLQWLKLIKEKKIKFIQAAGPRQIVFEDSNQQTPKVIFDLLYPQINISNNQFADLNDSSIVSKLTFGQNSFLLMGDMSIAGEQELLASNIDLKSDVLKVGHHGSKYSSLPEFLAKVKPKFGIIQSGVGNKFGHPHWRTLRNLQKTSIQILRNDQLGDIDFKSDSKTISWTNHH